MLRLLRLARIISVGIRFGLDEFVLAHARTRLLLVVVQRVLFGSPPVPHRGVESNVQSFVLHPQITAPVTISDPQGAGSAARSGTLNLTINPAVGPNQRVLVLLNQLQGFASPPPTVRAYSFVAPPRIDLASPPTSPPADTPTISVPFRGVEAGTYLVRVQVDGAESPLQVDGSGAYSAPQVIIL